MATCRSRYSREFLSTGVLFLAINYHLLVVACRVIISDIQGKCNLDFSAVNVYNERNFIGQFVTILSVNKTRDFRWALCAHFLLGVVMDCSQFLFLEEHHV